MDADECRRRLAAAPHGYLATASREGVPHLVPVVFALADDVIATAVDHKPKRTTALRRLRNIRENPMVCLLADFYDEDWSRLWWVRADAMAMVVEQGEAYVAAIGRLQQRHPQYRNQPPTGPVVLASVQRWSGWSAIG